MTLYKLENKIGTYWVIANDPTEAVNKLKGILDKNDYGFYDNRKVNTITVVAESIDNQFLTGKFLIL